MSAPALPNVPLPESPVPVLPLPDIRALYRFKQKGCVLQVARSEHGIW